MAVIIAGAATAEADDRVVVQLRSQSGRLTLSGRIDDFNGRELVLLAGAGSGIKRFAANEVVEIETAYTEPHRRAVELLQKGALVEASDALDGALDAEERTWVRREILALQVGVALQRQAYRPAIQRFLLIIRSDPLSPHYQMIPLVWTARTPSPPADADLQVWLTSSEMVERLIAASWLLEGPRREDAVVVLNALATETHPYLQRLAQAQLWRLRLTDPQLVLAEVQRWEQLTESWAPAIRSGPIFLVGRGFAQHQEWLNAASAWLWIPLRFPQRADLSAEAQWLASQSLLKAGDVGGSQRLAWEVTVRYAASPVAQTAREWLAQQRP